MSIGSVKTEIHSRYAGPGKSRTSPLARSLRSFAHTMHGCATAFGAQTPANPAVMRVVDDGMGAVAFCRQCAVTTP